MKKKRNNFYIKILLLPLVYTFTLFGATYDEKYSVTNSTNQQEKNFNIFMDGTFDEIINFDKIECSDGRINENSKTKLDEIIKKIKNYSKDGKNIKITVIGHTDRATDEQNEKTIDSGTYANKIQNPFRYSLDKKSSREFSKDYTNLIQSRLLDSNISKDIIFLEYRSGKDLAFGDETVDARERSNRVMVSMYVEKPLDVDSDRDGVFDNYDRCPNTPRASKVDKNGCPIDSDRDGVVDYKDSCANTPKGVRVDSKGCPLDSDGDGVVDYKDKCKDTIEGFNVDPDGCPLKSTLKLNFKPLSDKILTESSSEVQRFAEFMKKNKLYKAKITGHTDSVGKAVANMKLSQRRALAIKKVLVEEGVEASRLTTHGRGELDPIESNRLKEGRRVNRRIEVELFY